MPLYDYLCRSCEARFEAFVTAGGRATCAACGSEEVERLFTPFAGPFTVAPKGLAASRSNAQRAAREEQRRERREARLRERGQS